MFRLFAVIAAIAFLISSQGRARLAPFAHWLLDPAYEWSVQSRLAQIAHAIDGEAAAGRPFPTTSKGLAIFLEKFYGASTDALDPWGNPLYMLRDPRGLRVGSAGRDGERQTPDDLLSSPLHLR